MKGYIIDIEKETRTNNDYRRVLYTARYSQLVVMNVRPGEEIGEEVHGLDQFIRVEEGEGKVVLDGEEYSITDGIAIVIPAGTRHNVINTSEEKDLKIYTIYSPPEHQDGVVHTTKSDEEEEHFDGITTADRK